MTTAYGPGDPQTWGPPTGHPNDPRTEDHRCPECDTPMDDLDACPEPDCGWAPYEPDWEAIAADQAEARADPDPRWEP